MLPAIGTMNEGNTADASHGEHSPGSRWLSGTMYSRTVVNHSKTTYVVDGLQRYGLRSV